MTTYDVFLIVGDSLKFYARYLTASSTHLPTFILHITMTSCPNPILPCPWDQATLMDSTLKRRERPGPQAGISRRSSTPPQMVNASFDGRARGCPDHIPKGTGAMNGRDDT